MANIDLGDFREFKKVTSKCPKTPPYDQRFKRFIDAHARQAGLKLPNWDHVGNRACDWNVSLGQRPVRVTFDFRRFVNDLPNDLHVLQKVAEAGRWPTAWVVIAGVHDCMFLRRNVTFQTSAMEAFFRFLEQHPILKSRTLLVGMQYMVKDNEMEKEHPRRRQRFHSYSPSKSLYNCSRRLHTIMLQWARKQGVYMMPRWEVTRNYAEKEGYVLHYPESIIQSELPSLLTGLSCIAKSRQHGLTSALITAPSYRGHLLLLYSIMSIMSVAAAVCALVFVQRGRISWCARASRCQFH